MGQKNLYSVNFHLKNIPKQRLARQKYGMKKVKKLKKKFINITSIKYTYFKSE